MSAVPSPHPTREPRQQRVKCQTHQIWFPLLQLHCNTACWPRLRSRPPASLTLAHPPCKLQHTVVELPSLVPTSALRHCQILPVIARLIPEIAGFDNSECLPACLPGSDQKHRILVPTPALVLVLLGFAISLPLISFLYDNLFFCPPIPSTTIPILPGPEMHASVFSSTSRQAS